MTGVSTERIQRDLAELATFSAEGPGVTRHAYSPEYLKAQEWLGRRMEQAGLAVRVDGAGNLIGRFGPEGPPVITGSHVDSVFRGGTLDGTLGVVAAIECARLLVSTTENLRRPLEVVAFADEEGRFHGHLGSLVMAGVLGRSDLEHLSDHDGVALAEAMEDAGLSIESIGSAARGPEDIHACVELHVEQGPLLEHAGETIGVVQAICGVRRTTYRFRGTANHAGGTPQDMRRDAMMAAAQFMTESEALVKEADHTGPRLTFGILRASPQVDCVIPGEVEVTCELRSADRSELDALDHQVCDVAQRVARMRDLDVNHHEYHHLDPVELSDRIGHLVSVVCRDQGLSTMEVVSGAGHDAQSLAAITEAGMIFVPSQGGRSHCPEEATDPSDATAGANVLLGVLRHLLTEDALA
jgi:hydantoinase/carbamoylase family amidase